MLAHCYDGATMAMTAVMHHARSHRMLCGRKRTVIEIELVEDRVGPLPHTYWARPRNIRSGLASFCPEMR
jgi:hypothetical protein